MLEGKGAFDRVDATGKLALDTSAASLSLISGAVAPLWPQLAARLNAMKLRPGPAHVKLTLAIDKESARADRTNAQASIDLDAPQFKGSLTIAAKPASASLRDADLDKLVHGEVTLDTSISSEQGASLLTLLGLDGVIAARDGPGKLHGSISGAWGTPLRVKLDLTGAGLEVEAQGTADPFRSMDLKAFQANLSLKGRVLNLAPLFDLKREDRLAQDISLTSRVALANGKATFDDIDGTMAGSRLRGRRAQGRGRTRARRAGSRTGLEPCDRCGRARCVGAVRQRLSEELARTDCISSAARRAAGRQRIAAVQRHRERRWPIAGHRESKGRHRWRRGERQS
jgi:large subunit ribosomal protein L24